MPIVVDGNSVISAEAISILTEEAPQVIANYWCDLPDLIRVLELTSFAIVDLHVFTKSEFGYVGGMRIFEWVVFQQYPPEMKEYWLPLEHVVESDPRWKGVRENSIDTEFVLGFGGITSFNPKILSEVEPLRVFSQPHTRVPHTLQRIASTILDMVNDFASEIGAEQIVADFQGGLSDDEEMSDVSYFEPVEKALVRLRKTGNPGQGSFLLFDKTWALRGHLVKRAHEQAWTMYKLNS